MMTERSRSSRNWIIGVLGIAIGLLLFGLVQSNVAEDAHSTWRIPWPNTPSTAPSLIDIPLPTVATSGVLGVLLVLGALYLIITQRPQMASPYMGFLIFTVIFILLLWASANTSVDIVDMLARTVRLATPIGLGALAGILCERSGVINIAIEGLMLTGACVGFIGAILLGNTWLGVLAAVLAGGLMVLFHALLSIHFKIDQIISGTVINILAVGLTGFLRNNIILPLQSQGYGGGALPELPIPGLAALPVLGPLFFQHKPITYLTILLIPLISLLLFRTPWGLRTRAIGEHPRAADTVGINVNRLRFMNVFFSGLIAGLAGAWFSLESSFNFDDLMTNGRGFIALAAMIFGKWTPFGAMGGALLFSSADALQIKVQGLGFAMPEQFLLMLPYAITIVVLSGIVGRARPPAALGQPYKKQ